MLIFRAFLASDRPSRRLRELIDCPTGKSVAGVSSPSAKNISLNPSGKSLLELRASRLDKRGVGHRHERWAGCGGRCRAEGRTVRKRTAKSCGPDAPTLASTRDNALHCAGMVTTKPGHQGE